MPNFTGQLRSNEIFAALFNMIISQEVFADNIKGTDLVDKARVDGSMYGDTKLYYSTDALASSEWGNDAEAVNLLDIARPEAPECQAIVIDKFYQIALTVDDYMSKRAWSTEGAFSSFTSIMLGWMRDTKKVKEATEYNAFIGTDVVAGQTFTVAAGSDAKAIANEIADIMSLMTDYNRDFNEYGHLRRYSEGEIMVIYNKKYLNKIKTVDLPTIFDNAGLKKVFAEESLQARYFGTVNTVSKTAADANTRALEECTISSGTGAGHYFAGDKIPTGATLVSGGAIVVPTYQEDAKVIAKMYIKLPPYMSGFEAGTSFFNARSLTTNHYLTWGTNTKEHLLAFPCVTIKEANA